MKFSEALNDFMEAKQEYENFHDCEWTSMSDNRKRASRLKERFELESKRIDSFITEEHFFTDK